MSWTSNTLEFNKWWNVFLNEFGTNSVVIQDKLISCFRHYNTELQTIIWNYEAGYQCKIFDSWILNCVQECISNNLHYSLNSWIIKLKNHAKCLQSLFWKKYNEEIKSLMFISFSHYQKATKKPRIIVAMELFRQFDIKLKSI